MRLSARGARGGNGVIVAISGSSYWRKHADDFINDREGSNGGMV